MEPKVKQAISNAKSSVSKAKSKDVEAKPADSKSNNSKLAIIVRLKGSGGIKKTRLLFLAQLNLTRRYSACLADLSVAKTAAKKVGDYIAWGELDEKTLSQLIEKRLKTTGQPKPLDAKFYSKFSVANSTELANLLLSGKVTPIQLKKNGARPYFALHPPVKGLTGIKSHYPKGSMGNWSNKINSLVSRMI